MASARPNPGGQTDGGAEPMDWQTDTEVSQGMVSINMSRKDAQILLEVGLKKEVKRQLTLDLTIQADDLGLHVCLPLPYDIDESMKAVDLYKFINGFRSHVLTNCKKFPFHFEQNEVLGLTAVTNALFSVLHGLDAHLDVDTENEVFGIYALNKDVLQKCIESIQDTVKEERIEIIDIRDELYQDAGWCNFQKSLKNQDGKQEFVVKVDEKTILITGLYDSVKKVYDHLRCITDNLQRESFKRSKNKKATSHRGVESELTENPADIEVEFQVDSHEVFSYLQAFQTMLDNVDMKPYEETDRRGFVLVGSSNSIESAEKHLKNVVKEITDKILKFEDNGYFSKPEGQQFMEEKIQQGCEVLFEISKKKCNNICGESESQKRPSPTWHEGDGHGSWHWTIQQKCHIVLAESKVEEMSADVVLHVVEMKSPGSKLHIQQKKSYQIFSVDVPRYTTGLTLDIFNERLRNVFQKLADDNIQSVAVSIDNTGTWPIGGFVPRIIRSFCSFLREKGRGIKLSLLLCSAETASLEQAKGIIQRILEEEYGKLESSRKVPDLDQPLQVRVVQGLLHKTEADILVNTTAPDLDLFNGAVSRSLSEAAGREMQEEIDKKYSRYIELEPGEITVTQGYRLKCKHVIHGVLGGFEEQQADIVYKECIMKFMTNCLKKADGLKCRTIAFPAIGTGRLKYPIDIVATEMFWAVHEFGNEHPHTTLKEVQFVLYTDDQAAFKVFKEKEKEICKSNLMDFVSSHMYTRDDKPSAHNTHSYLSPYKIRFKKSSFKKNSTEEIKKQQLSVGSSEVAFHFIGPKEKIEKAKQHIEDRLELLQSKGGSPQQYNEEIHGISYINYELLRHLHGDTFLNKNQQGFLFDWKDGILKITGHQKNIGVVKAEINSLLKEQVSDLPKVKVDVKSMDEDDIDSFLARKSLDLCHLYLPEEKIIVICGPDQNLVGKEKIILDELRSDSARKSLQNQTRNVKEESSKLVLVDEVPEDIYLVMCEKYTDMDHFVITHNARRQTAMVNKQHIKQLQKRLSEVNSLQKETLAIPDDRKHLVFKENVKVSSVNNVVCVYQPEQSCVTVFGTDRKSINEEIHKIKLKAGMIETTNRTSRELTESFHAPDSPDPDDGWTSVSSVSQADESWIEPQNPTNEKTATHTGGARPKGHYGPTPVGKAGSSTETFKTSEGIPVYVYKQDILRVNVDCIVNAANDKLKHGGGIAQVISKAAGRSLDKECEDHIKDFGKLKPGGVYVSSAGKLQFKCVIHAVGPRWSDYKPHTHDKVGQCKDDLQNAVFKSLTAAEKQGLKTIAIPAISSAIFAVPEEICTSMYAKGVIAYSKQAKPSTRLEAIHFIDSFPHIVCKIQQRFREMLYPTGQLGQGSSQTNISKPRQTTSHSSADIHRPKQHKMNPTSFPWFGEKAYDEGFKQELHCHFSPTLHLIVDQGSVFDKARKVDAIVCSDNRDGRGKGFIAKTLLEKGGHKYKSAAERAFKQNVHFGDVVMVNGDGTGFRKVFLAIMWQKESTDTKSQRESKFRSMFKAVFRKVVTENCKTIMMPLMFTGEGKVKPSFCTERLLESFVEFSKEAKSKLTVYLINTEKRKTETIMQMTKDFVGFQKTLLLSSHDQPAPQRPPSPSLAGLSNQRRGGKMDGHGKSGQDFSRSQTSQQRPRADARTDKGAMSSSLTSWSSGSSGSDSQFYVDDSQGKKSSDKSQDPSLKTVKDSAAAGDSHDENCVICMDTVNKPKKLKCGHVFCTDCIDNYFSNYKKVCPTCGVVCGVVKGDQPPGTMDVRFDQNFHCAGYDRVGTHIVTYSFNSGTQGPDHPNPGRPYKGITRNAFLPDTKEGREVLQMLKVAFERKLVFTIGSSRTTGQEGVITWNDIHHKTNHKPNTPFGYPDPGYLDRVKDELAAKGVTPDEIGSK